MDNYLLVVLADVFLAVSFVLQRLYQKQKGEAPKAVMLYLGLTGMFTAVLFICIGGFDFRFTWYSFLLALAVSGLGLTYTVLGFRMLKTGTLALYSLFLMTGGMIVPYFFGVLFLDETVSILRILGLLVIICGVVVSNLKSIRQGGKLQGILLGVIIFFLNGFVSVGSKIHQLPQYASQAVSTENFVMLTGLIKMVFCFITMFFLREKTEEKRENVSWLKIVAVTFLAAAASGVSYLFQLFGASNLPATVIYPMVTGGSIVFTALAGWAALKEKPDKAVVIGMLLCVAGTCCFL